MDKTPLDWGERLTRSYAAGLATASTVIKIALLPHYATEKHAAEAMQHGVAALESEKRQALENLTWVRDAFFGKMLEKSENEFENHPFHLRLLLARSRVEGFYRREMEKEVSKGEERLRQIRKSS